MKRLLVIALALAIVSCDSGESVAGTSSETQTALQGLADNSSAITSKLVPISPDLPYAARAASVEEDSTFEEFRRLWCSGTGTSYSLYYKGAVKLDWTSSGVGPDGTSSSCSLKESIHTGREFQVDSLGRSDLTFHLRQYDTLSRKVYQGTGTWDLRSGLSLTYLSLFADIDLRKAVFRQEIRISGSCRLDIAFTDSLTDTGWTNELVDAPVVCGGATVGRFLWDRVGLPQVFDSRGGAVLPRQILPSRFPEDSLGLRAAVLSLERDSEDSIASLRLEVRMRFLPWDTLAVAQWIHLQVPSDTVRLGDSVRWSGRPVDTIEIRVRWSDIDTLREPHLPCLVAPFKGYGGEAWSKPLRL